MNEPQNPVVITSAADRKSRLEKDVSELRSTISSIEAKLAEGRPVQDVVKLLLYFWAAISVILGIFGWKQFSDIETMVSKQVQLTLPGDQAKWDPLESTCRHASLSIL